MKLSCPCGELIRDTTDYLPHKAHAIPDQDLFELYERLEGLLDEAASLGRRDGPALDRLKVEARRALSSVTRTQWLCTACGRLYVDRAEGDPHCFEPRTEHVDVNVLASVHGAAWKPAG